MIKKNDSYGFPDIVGIIFGVILFIFTASIIPEQLFFSLIGFFFILPPLVVICFLVSGVIAHILRAIGDFFK
jgi:hypothetical protein